MSEHVCFHFSSIEQLSSAFVQTGGDIPWAKQTACLSRPLPMYGKEIPNRLVVQPMEGCDAEEDGSPSPLTLRRYRRFAKGGAGLIWIEAVAICEAGRANSYQLWLNKHNVDAFARLVEEIRQAAQEAGFPPPFTVLQLNHAGRYVAERPVIARPDARMERPGVSYHLASDEELDALAEDFVAAARLAQAAGFDAVDVKCCHGYLLGELLSAFAREGSHGGSLSGRARLLHTVIDRLHREEDIPVAVRMNAFDAFSGGFGSSDVDPLTPDFSQAQELARLLVQAGVRLINVTGGNPYYNPYITRPCSGGATPPPEHPTRGVRRLLEAAKAVRAACPPDAAVVCSGLSWLREFGCHAAAGGIEAGWFDLAGFGRQSIAYPDFARDLLQNGTLEKEKSCVACSKCSELLRGRKPVGCVIRDADTFLPFYCGDKTRP